MNLPPATSPAGVSSATAAMRERIVPSAGTPLLFDVVRARAPEGIRLDVWYCNRRLPAISSKPGIGRVRRYAAPAWSAYMAVAEVGAAFRTPHADREDETEQPALLSTERFVGRPLGTQRRRDCSESHLLESAIAYLVYFNVPEPREAEFNRWYNEEHLPMLLASPQWGMCRRFRMTESNSMPWTHVALHYLLDLRALQSPERDVARSTPWRRQLEAEGWFVPQYRVFYPVREFTP